MPAIQLAIGKQKPNVRIFRNNVGTGWQGECTRKGDLLIIRNPRPLHAGLCEGSSDLIGWTTVEITPDMVGRKMAIFTALEVKAPRGRISPEQRNFLEQVHRSGGIARIAHSAEEAIKML